MAVKVQNYEPFLGCPATAACSLPLPNQNMPKKEKKTKALAKMVVLHNWPQDAMISFKILTGHKHLVSQRKIPRFIAERGLKT
nr:hypothetical protein [Tanacetum cinerariifolium]